MPDTNQLITQDGDADPNSLDQQKFINSLQNSVLDLIKKKSNDPNAIKQKLSDINMQGISEQDYIKMLLNEYADKSQTDQNNQSLLEMLDSLKTRINGGEG